MPPTAGRLRHGEPKRRAHLRGESEMLAGKVIELFPTQKPGCESRPHPRPHQSHRLGVRAKRVRGTVAGTGIDPALATLLECARTTRPAPADIPLSRPPTGASRFPDARSA